MTVDAAKNAMVDITVRLAHIVAPGRIRSALADVVSQAGHGY